MDLTATAVRALMLYSLAEFQSGNATTIRVTVNGNSFGITDDGRGHPLDKTIGGTPYLKFVYTHFDYPFESGQSAPIQLQAIGMSLVNAICSELILTVIKIDETLRLQYRDGQLRGRSCTAMRSEETGINISATINSQLQAKAADIEALEAWLIAVLFTAPALKLFFNDRQLQLPTHDPIALYQSN